MADKYTIVTAIIALGTVGAIGYILYTQYVKPKAQGGGGQQQGGGGTTTTTTSQQGQTYHVHVFNGCDLGAWVYYTDASGNQNKVYMYPVTTYDLDVLANSNIRIVDETGNELLKSTQITSDVAITTCVSQVKISQNVQPQPGGVKMGTTYIVFTAGASGGQGRQYITAL